MADAKVLTVPEGGILVLFGVEFDGATMALLVEQVRDVVGHDRWIVLDAPGDGTVEVWGPDEDLAAKVAGLLVRAAKAPGESR